MYNSPIHIVVGVSHHKKPQQRDVGMHIKDHVKVVLPIVAMDQLADGMKSRVEETVGLVPMPVEVLSQQITHGVAQENAVWIHHRHQFENQMFAQFLGYFVRRDEKVNQTLHNKGGRSF